MMNKSQQVIRYIAEFIIVRFNNDEQKEQVIRYIAEFIIVRFNNDEQKSKLFVI